MLLLTHTFDDCPDNIGKGPKKRLLQLKNLANF